MSVTKHVTIEDLQDRLAKLANQWRKEHSEDRYERAEEVVRAYHKVMDRLWSLGWDGANLLPDSELPTHLMPAYFNEKWTR